MGMDPFTIALIAAGVSAGGSIIQGQNAKATADVNAELQRREGRQEEDAAIAQAAKIRKAGAAAASRANASLAASGVAIGEGTAVRINEDIYQESESDAYSTLLTGSRRKQSAYNQAGMTESEGRNARTAGYINAGATLLSAGAQQSKWKTSQKKGG